MVKLNDLYDYIEHDDILLIEKSGGKLDSFSLMDNDKNCTIVMNEEGKHIDCIGKKEQIAHELGHCATGAFYTPGTLNLRSRCEYRADKWAIKKLIPKDELVEAIENGYTETWQLSDYFEVTEDFIIKALKFYGYYFEAI